MKLAAIFDMDGTVTDSVGGIARTLNAILARRGLPTHPLEKYNAELVGRGSEYLVHRALPEGSGEALYESVFREYIAAYRECCAAGVPTYPGIPEMLRALRGNGIATAVLTNKPQDAADELRGSTFNGLLDCVLGAAPDIPRKPDPALLPLLIQKLDCRCIAYAGDSEVDMQVGKTCGVFTIGVTWGTRTGEFLKAHGADALADTAEELTRIILAQKEA